MQTRKKERVEGKGAGARFLSRKRKIGDLSQGEKGEKLWVEKKGGGGGGRRKRSPYLKLACPESQLCAPSFPFPQAVFSPQGARKTRGKPLESHLLFFWRRETSLFLFCRDYLCYFLFPKRNEREFNHRYFFFYPCFPSTFSPGKGKFNAPRSRALPPLLLPRV